MGENELVPQISSEDFLSHVSEHPLDFAQSIRQGFKNHCIEIPTEDDSVELRNLWRDPVFGEMGVTQYTSTGRPYVMKDTMMSPRTMVHLLERRVAHGEAMSRPLEVAICDLVTAFPDRFSISSDQAEEILNHREHLVPFHCDVQETASINSTYFEDATHFLQDAVSRFRKKEANVDRDTKRVETSLSGELSAPEALKKFAKQASDSFTLNLDTMFPEKATSKDRSLHDSLVWREALDFDSAQVSKMETFSVKTHTGRSIEIDPKALDPKTFEQHMKTSHIAKEEKYFRRALQANIELRALSTALEQNSGLQAYALLHTRVKHGLRLTSRMMHDILDGSWKQYDTSTFESWVKATSAAIYKKAVNVGLVGAASFGYLQGCMPRVSESPVIDPPGLSEIDPTAVPTESIQNEGSEKPEEIDQQALEQTAEAEKNYAELVNIAAAGIYAEGQAWLDTYVVPTSLEVAWGLFDSTRRPSLIGDGEKSLWAIARVIGSGNGDVEDMLFVQVDPKTGEVIGSYRMNPVADQSKDTPSLFTLHSRVENESQQATFILRTDLTNQQEGVFNIGTISILEENGTITDVELIHLPTNISRENIEPAQPNTIMDFFQALLSVGVTEAQAAESEQEQEEEIVGEGKNLGVLFATSFGKGLVDKDDPNLPEPYRYIWHDLKPTPQEVIDAVVPITFGDTELNFSDTFTFISGGKNKVKQAALVVYLQDVILDIPNPNTAIGGVNHLAIWELRRHNSDGSFAGSFFIVSEYKYNDYDKTKEYQVSSFNGALNDILVRDKSTGAFPFVTYDEIKGQYNIEKYGPTYFSKNFLSPQIGKMFLVLDPIGEFNGEFLNHMLSGKSDPLDVATGITNIGLIWLP